MTITLRSTKGSALTHAELDANFSDSQSGASRLLGSVVGANTITATLAPTLTAYASGQSFVLIPASANSGAVTLNIDGLGAKSIVAGGSALSGGELVAGIPYLVTYDGTQFNLSQSTAASSSFVQSGSGTITRTAQAKMQEIVSLDDFTTAANFNTAYDALGTAGRYAFAGQLYTTSSVGIGTRSPFGGAHQKGALHLSGAPGSLNIEHTGMGTNLKIWNIQPGASTGILEFNSVNDDGQTNAQTLMQLQRNGTFGLATYNIVGRLLFVGDTSGNISMSGSELQWDPASGALGIGGAAVNGYRLSITGGAIFTGTTGITPMAINQTDGAADAKKWVLQATGGSLLWRLLNDAESVGTAWLTVARSGTTVGNITFGGPILTSAPTGGAGAWELGIANVVSPTAPNRTITVEIGGTAYYIHAKTTND